MGVLALILVAAVSAEPGLRLAAPTAAELERAIGQASCTGEYADAMLALSARTREFERAPESNYSYCLRNTATYECLSYASDGRMRKRHYSVVAHGTAFAYREKNGETLLLTNDHVATWPAVTDDDHDVADVPDGCKKVDEQLRLVRNESDDDEAGQVVVTKVVTDPLLDAAVLKARAGLNVMPYRVGRSSLLKAGNVVEIRGYPLGILQATNSGKVVTSADPDRERGWNHLDFVTDALVTKGNSGSPVFAVSCRTGEYELVGLYHAGYRGSPALNTVVGIDQLRDLMDNLRRSKPLASDSDAPGPAFHAEALAAANGAGALPFFKLGDRIARARAGAGGALFYDVFGEGFPAQPRVALTLEEAADGTLSAFAADTGRATLSRTPLLALDAETQDLARRLHELTQRQWRDTLAYRTASAEWASSRASTKRTSELAKALSGRKADGLELVKSLSDAAQKLAEGPHPPPADVASAPAQARSEAVSP